MTASGDSFSVAEHLAAALDLAEKIEAGDGDSIDATTLVCHLRVMSEDLPGVQTAAEELAEALRPLLAAAEAEVGEKETTPERMKGGAEYWAAQDNVDYQVPGVARRVALAHAVLAARSALALFASRKQTDT